MGHAGGRAHVPGHICSCPFTWLHNTLLDHWFQIVVFHTLYLMVPLLKRHSHLSQDGFTTKSVNMRGTELQTSGQCVYKTSYIFIWLGGSRGSKWLSSRFPPSPSQKGDLPVIHIWGPHFLLDYPKGSAVGSWGWFQFPESNFPAEILHELPQLGICKVPKVCL